MNLRHEVVLFNNFKELFELTYLKEFILNFKKIYWYIIYLTIVSYLKV